MQISLFFFVSHKQIPKPLPLIHKHFDELLRKEFVFIPRYIGTVGPAQ